MYRLLVLVSCTLGLAACFSCPQTVRQSCRCYTRHDRLEQRDVRHLVNCASRQLQEVPFLDFKSGTRIYKLSLQNNSILSLSSEDFARKVRIQELDISHNPLGDGLETRLLADNVVYLKKLIAREVGLNLQNSSSLSFIKDLFTLEELDISRNFGYRVDMLPALFIENDVHALRKLSLSLCRIRHINAHAFFGLHNLRELDLSFNYLTRVPRALKRLSLLRKLTLHRNDITVVYHGDFSELRCLEVLDLSRNLLGQMEAIRNGAFFGVGNSLTDLYLHNSDLSFIPTNSISNLRRLKFLDISDNEISFMSNKSFVGEYKLRKLDISGNPWLIDDEMFSGIQNSLQSLAMRRIGISFIPTLPLSRLTNLVELDISNNMLTTLTVDSLAGVTARILNMSGNNIRYISPDSFSGYRLPIVLDVSDNVLDSLDFVFDSRMCTMFTLNITNNGFLCDCRIEKLINSKRVNNLIGNCATTDGVIVRFDNSTMVRNLERVCGETPSTFCLWWVPYSGVPGSSVSLTWLILLVLIQRSFQGVFTTGVFV